MSIFLKGLRDFFFRGYETKKEEREEEFLDFLILEREQLFVEELEEILEKDGPYCR
jgi:hypothetical protein